MSLRTLALGLGLLLAAASARADWGGCYGPYLQNMYARDMIPPYYALYPPVYYSYPVPRTYGYSPFAYPPGTPTPDLQIQELPQPKVMINPYFKPEGEDASARTVGYRGKVVVNPFFYENEDRATERTDSPAKVR